VVALPDGALLNRFWTRLASHAMSFREDTALAAHSARSLLALS